MFIVTIPRNPQMDRLWLRLSPGCYRGSPGLILATFHVCTKQKILTRRDDGAALQKLLCNMHNKNIYNENWKISAARQQFSVRGSISFTARPRTRAA
jgi:hypothetical protein